MTKQWSYLPFSNSNSVLNIAVSNGIRSRSQSEILDEVLQVTGCTTAIPQEGNDP